MADHDLVDLAARFDLEPLLTIDELARLAHQSRRTIERRIREGVIPVKHFSPRCVRIRRDDAAAYLAVTEPGTVAAPTTIHHLPGR